ncbi:MAG: protein-L-isoaspartate(D-aspartate) O-methyltransferase [Candidatus Krumholzibacteriota bacterium]|nr:protein-L-isoaspartate(D-aspartate) O-methyltransferase [Candidatus Krumholzibacteriota bacterium]
MEKGLDYRIARRRMVEEQLSSRDIQDKRILKAFLEVPRHIFVDPAIGARAYDDCSFPIGLSQTISQPYIQALMMQYLMIRPEDRVLEVGTGSGYQTAILSLLAREVYSVERLPQLSKKAGDALSKIKTGRIRLKVTDGFNGWGFYAPFDKIIVSATIPENPEVLLDQLAEKGLLIAPVSFDGECLMLFSKNDGVINRQRLSECAFVPLLKGVG